jgi:uncharacterized protein YndB with AHSA1/START domain
MMANTKLDLVFERTTSIPVEKLWKGWTHPETLMKWFCPRPWKVTDCRIDLKPGGEFYTLMEGPSGEKNPNHGCYLEVIENEKLVWTGMMTKGFRPAPSVQLGFHFVATIIFSKTDSGSSLKATVAHADEEGRNKHEAMGFQEGWGMAFKQLEELMDGK